MARAAALGALILGLLASTVAADPRSAQRVAELDHLVRHDCGSCHGMTLKGGLGPALLPESLADRDVDTLAAIILHGMPGTPMPPWAFEITDEEAAWIARRLKRGW